MRYALKIKRFFSLSRRFTELFQIVRVRTIPVWAIIEDRLIRWKAPGNRVSEEELSSRGKEKEAGNVRCVGRSDSARKHRLLILCKNVFKVP